MHFQIRTRGNFEIHWEPTILITNRKTYVLVTGIQKKKVYAADKSGNIMQGFPIYESGSGGIGKAKNNDKNAIVVNGNDEEIILYSQD